MQPLPRGAVCPAWDTRKP